MLRAELQSGWCTTKWAVCCTGWETKTCSQLWVCYEHEQQVNQTPRKLNSSVVAALGLHGMIDFWNGEDFIIVPFCSCCVYIQADRSDVHLVVLVFIYHVWENLTLSECRMHSDKLQFKHSIVCHPSSSTLVVRTCSRVTFLQMGPIHVALPLLNKAVKQKFANPLAFWHKFTLCSKQWCTVMVSAVQFERSTHVSQILACYQMLQSGFNVMEILFNMTL